MATEAETNQSIRDAYECALEAALEVRNAEVKTLPDPMELAKLAVALKPELAKGTLEQQLEALAAARGLFDLAVRNAVKLSGAERQGIWIGLMRSELKKEAEEEGPEAYLNYEPTAGGGDQLRAYIGKEAGQSRVPATYRNNRWEKVLKKSGFSEEGKHFIHKTYVDEEIAEIRKEEVFRKKIERGEMQAQEDAQKTLASK